MHEAEPRPRWKLFQKLRQNCGLVDERSSEDGLAGMFLHGSLAGCGQWLLRTNTAKAKTGGGIELRRLLRQQRAARASGYTRGCRGQWPLPNKHEQELPRQLWDGASRGWWQEFCPEDAQLEIGDYLCWPYFGVKQQRDSGERVIRGCLAPTGINDITSHLEKFYMAGVDGVISLLRAMRASLGMQAELCLARRAWRPDRSI